MSSAALPISPSPQPPQSAGSLTISPIFIELKLGPDDRDVETSITLQNTSTQPYQIELSIVDLGQLADSAGVLFLGTNADKLDTKYSLGNWLELPEANVTLPPDSQYTVPIRITNRSSLTPGGHYAALVGRVQTSQQQSEDQENVAVTPAFASTIFVTKTGGERYNLELESVRLPPAWMRLPQEIQGTFKNNGNVHAVPRGLITVKNPRGQQVAQATINQNSRPVLPETSRTLIEPLAYQAAPTMPGIYTVEVAWRYDGRDQFSTATSQVFFIGPHALATALLVVLMTTIIVRRFMRRRQKSANITSTSTKPK